MRTCLKIFLPLSALDHDAKAIYDINPVIIAEPDSFLRFGARLHPNLGDAQLFASLNHLFGDLGWNHEVNDIWFRWQRFEVRVTLVS